MKQLYRLIAVRAIFGFCFLLNAEQAIALLPDHVSLSLTSGKADTEIYRLAVISNAGTGKAGQFAIAKRMNQLLSERSFDRVVMLGDNIPHSFMFVEASKEALNFWAASPQGNVLDSVSLKPVEPRP